jgi:hypothetical protein
MAAETSMLTTTDGAIVALQLPLLLLPLRLHLGHLCVLVAVALTPKA